MESLFMLFYKRLANTDTRFVRYLYEQINWNSQLIGITGARGTGKTTLLLQHIKKTFGTSSKKVLFASLDHLWFSGNKLFDLGVEFVQQGGTHLFLDEVHKYANWSQEIKNLYDNFPELKIVFTGSSLLEIYKGNADLSRRAIHYMLHGMSFREYLSLEEHLHLPVFTLEDILSHHVDLATRVNGLTKPLPAFNAYLKHGCYPYYKEEKQFYHSKLLNTLNIILESDLPAAEKIESFSIQKIKQLLWIIAKKVPFVPNITELSNQIGVSRNSLLNYLTFLKKAQLINLLHQDVSGLSVLAKPEKVYLNNTNLIFALEENKPDIGNIRETFFFNQLEAIATVTSSKKTDFTVNNRYSFEIGGKNKGREQVMGLPEAYLALDNIEYGFANKIPLWLFGLLY
jgi:predicted AAA+ superfamily ATPase